MDGHMKVGMMWDFCITCSWPPECIYHGRSSKHPNGQNGPVRWFQVVSVICSLSASTCMKFYGGDYKDCIRQRAQTLLSFIYQKSSSDPMMSSWERPFTEKTTGHLVLS